MHERGLLNDGIPGVVFMRPNGAPDTTRVEIELRVRISALPEIVEAREAVERAEDDEARRELLVAVDRRWLASLLRLRVEDWMRAVVADAVSRAPRAP